MQKQAFWLIFLYFAHRYITYIFLFIISHTLEGVFHFPVHTQFTFIFPLKPKILFGQHVFSSKMSASS